ncbi:hypothetical protein Rhe02_85520 [Rhizocola hellebori]|uniref:Uncharacterized protein n=1 Tax=Rhizocola hellebori TaxID=1392758 RepID=A0A8J3QGL7_9ACTN|nr:hypothetical protein [Rhizocola hellebori]GIH10485.1 hypothetical protein Rhe02_85520 [Rhizocola hellebori]
MATEPVSVPPPHAPSRAWRLSGLRETLAQLFPQGEARRRGKWDIPLVVLVVLLGTAISLGRTTGAGPFQTIWEEDARDLLTDALNNPAIFNVFKPYVGYFQVLPRVMAQVATWFPLSWAAAVMSIEAALVCSLLAFAVYVASGTHFRHPLARFLVSAPLLFSATAENWLAEIYNRPATVQFFLVYAIFWLLLWVPASRAGRITQVAIVAVSALSTFLVVPLIPLALVRLWVRRDRVSLVLAGLLTAGLALQMAGLLLGLTDRSFASPRYNPLWALENYAIWAVPHSMLGWNQAWALPTFARLGLGWAAVIVPVLVALRKVTQPKWVLAIVAGAHSVGLACITVMANGMATQRYLLPVQMLLFTALVALLIPKSGVTSLGTKAPLILLACLVMVLGAINYRHYDTWRNKSPLWTQEVRKAFLSCAATERREVIIRSGPAPYYSLVTVPCHLFRNRPGCEAPFCVDLSLDPVPPAKRAHDEVAAG